MNKSEIYQYLTGQNIPYEVTEHPAVFNMEELDSISLPYPEWDAKNLFVRDDKKRNYYLITVRGDKRVDLKAFRKAHGLRALSFASPEELHSLLGLIPGAVTPLGLLNDETRSVHLYLDSQFCGNRIGVHPNDNTATVWLRADDLMKLIQVHGNPAEFTAFEHPAAFHLHSPTKYTAPVHTENRPKDDPSGGHYFGLSAYSSFRALASAMAFSWAAGGQSS